MADVWRRLLQRILAPWYDRETAQETLRHSEEIRERAIAARIELEQVRRDYILAAKRMQRR